METRLNTKNIFLLLISLFAVASYAEKKPVAVNKAIIENFVVTPVAQKDAHKKDPLFGFQLDFTQKYNSDNEIIYRSDMKEGESLIFDQNLSNGILRPGEYIQIKDSRNKPFLFDGSFIIEFNEMPDLENFAVMNNITFVTSLSDISMGVFKPKNLSELDSKIQNFKFDENIISVGLDLIDPSIKPE
tara:strand:+ start:773 stop:1333 length:561 start_codon:yes stop_codon:yes gene_type:complete